MRNIGNRALITNEILRCRVLEMLVQNTIQSSGLVLVPVNPILDLFGSISSEVVRLSLHRAHACVHEEQPIRHLPKTSAAIQTQPRTNIKPPWSTNLDVLPRPGRVANIVVLIVPLHRE